VRVVQRSPLRQFVFSAEEIDGHVSNRQMWHEFVRRREAEILLSLFAGRTFGLALELGAGNGLQSVTLSRFCNRLICTEKDASSHLWLGSGLLQRNTPNVEYRLCDAQDLSQFDDGSFDLIVSSNLLEHVPDVDRCLAGCRRVMKDDALMLHTMPNRWWKLFSAGLAILRFHRPGVHGVTGSHRREFAAFGASAWKKRFQNNGFAVDEIVGMPFYVGHGNRFIPVIKAGNRVGIPATYLYVVTKTPPAGARGAQDAGTSR
jgi:2-polyprenyl-3-methyl-5-hydroxy-6-metoxy-1,4-benzoquinol methylase